MRTIAACVCVSLLLAVAPAAVPQERLGPAEAGHYASQQPTFRSTTRLIVTTVAVKDRDGNAVEGLTAKDFIVTEDNEPQDIAFLEYQRLDNQTPLPAITLRVPVTHRVRSPVSDVPSLVQPGIAVPTARDDRFRNRD
jgi:hypothetical protein